MFDYTVETEKSIDEAVNALGNALQEEQFGVLWDFNLQETLQSKGFDYEHEYRILEVCSPKAAADLLGKNQQVGYLLPCKIVVYDDHGQTKIGMPKTTDLLGLVGDESLQGTAEDVETRLASCMDKAAQG